MKAGELKHYITIEKPKMVVNDRGGKDKSWETFASCWASIKPVSGREFVAGIQTESEITTHIKIRYLAGIKNDMRVKSGSVYYKIEYVIEDLSDYSVLIYGSKTESFQ